MFFDSAAVVENPTAVAAAAAAGRDYSCDDIRLAVPECFIARNWDQGWVGELFATITNNLGANVVAMTRANFTAASSQIYKGASSYTRCVWEVNRGMVDICIGDFWETNERRGIAPFSSSFDLDTMRLLTMPVGGPGGGASSFEAKQLLDIFRPFATGVWGLMVAMFVFAGVAMYIVEAGSGNPDFEYEDELELPPLRYVMGFCKGFYLSTMGLLTAGPAFTATRWSGRFITLGFACFVYIAVASYAAKLVDFLVNSDSSPGRVSSMTDLVTKGQSICLLEAISDLVPEVPSSKRVGMDDYGPMVEKMYRNAGCAASLIGKTQYLSHIVGQKAVFDVCTDPRDPFQHTTCVDPSLTQETIDLGDPQSPDFQKYCDILLVEDSAFSLAIGISFPVAPDLLDYISSWVVSMRLDNSISKLRDKWVTSQYPPVCPVEYVPGLGLTIEQMAGTYTISAACMVLGLLVYFIQACMYMRKAGKDEDMAPLVPAEDEPKGAEGKEGKEGKDGKEGKEGKGAMGKDNDNKVASAEELPGAEKNNKKFEDTVIEQVSAKMEALNERITSLEKAQARYAQGHMGLFGGHNGANGTHTKVQDPAVSGWLSFLNPPPGHSAKGGSPPGSNGH